MITQGLALTVIGMAAVFAFLAVLVLVMVLSARIANRFFPESGGAPAPPEKRVTPETAVAIATVKRLTESSRRD